MKGFAVIGVIMGASGTVVEYGSAITGSATLGFWMVLGSVTGAFASVLFPSVSEKVKKHHQFAFSVLGGCIATFAWFAYFGPPITSDRTVAVSSVSAMLAWFVLPAVRQLILAFLRGKTKEISND